MSIKVKHSKIRNTGLLFEFLVRQVTVDVLNKSKNMNALKILKKRFNENSLLGDELKLYSTLMNEKIQSEKKADFLINEVMNKRQKISNNKLKREKYNLIKEIKKHFDMTKFLSSKVDNYKINASIYKLFEYNNKLSPEQKTENYFNILEHVTTENTSKDVRISTMGKYTESMKKDSDLRILSYKILLEKFNKKYSNLDNNQRKLLKAYINNITNTNSLKEYLSKSIPSIKKQLMSHSRTVTDKVVKIKLKECINSIKKLCEIKGENVKDNVVITLLRYYELLKELKKSENKNKKTL
tara:strand:+ start:219 stop:1109 length:891 start_codon:yes stop_codon:yes gene_type:complete